MNENGATLYAREGAYIPRVAAVHDLCGYGKCSLGVAIPVLSAAGCDVCPVPTGLFSSATRRSPAGTCTTPPTCWPITWRPGRTSAWRSTPCTQASSARPSRWTSSAACTPPYPDALRVVDPVMADHGKVYPTYTPELCARHGRAWPADADILTPNLTEAAIILGEPIGDEWAARTSLMPRRERMVRRAAGTRAPRTSCSRASSATASRDPQLRGAARAAHSSRRHNEYLPYMLHGTGDLYASCLLAAVMAGRPLAEAVRLRRATSSHDAMIVSAQAASTSATAA